MTSKRTEEP